MRAVDTNILARYYLNDDVKQARIARRIVADGNLFIPKTVILELAWILRAVAEKSATEVHNCLDHLIRLPGIVVEDRQQIEAAMRHAAHGIDFADALHLAASSECSEMLTFDDRGYARRAKRHQLRPSVRVPMT